jgi:replicative DNA helicase
LVTANPDSPQHSAEAEQAVLGSILLSPALLAELTGKVTPEDFYLGHHKDIFEAMLRLAEADAPTSETAIIVELERRDLLEKMPGGPGYLAILADRAAPAQIAYWVDNLHQDRTRRELAAFHLRSLQEIREGRSTEASVLVSQAQAGLDNLSDTRTSNDVIGVDDSLIATMERMEELSKRSGGITGVPTGIADFDSMTAGLQPGQMIVIAARPGVGKSTLGLDVARSAAIKHNLPALICSLEMSHEEITMRLLSAEARVPLSHIKTGMLSDDEWDRIAKKYKQISEAPLFIDDTANLTMPEIKAKARRIKQRHGLALIVIDYLQLMSGTGRTDSRQEQVSQMSRDGKLLAKELELPVIIMSQLNRESSKRADQKPALTDLRESGSIEQDADMVLLIFREDMVDPESARVGEADLILAKHRNGPTGTVPVAFQGHYSRFMDMGQAA